MRNALAAALVAAFSLAGCAAPPSPPALDARLLDAVVHVTSPGYASTGFVVGPRLIAAPHHSTFDSNTFEISGTGTDTVTGWIVRRSNLEEDWALIGVAEDLPVAPLALECAGPRPGERLVIAGFPMNSPGVVLSTGIASPVDADGDIEIDVAAIYGSSGSPAFNGRGRVVAMLFGVFSARVPLLPFPVPLGWSWLKPIGHLCAHLEGRA